MRVILPVLLGLPLLWCDPLQENYSVILSQPQGWLVFLLCLLPAAAVDLSLLYRLLNRYLEHWQPCWYGMLAGGIAALLIPYPEEGSLAGSLHVLSACAAFALLNAMLYQLTLPDARLHLRYLFLLTLTLMLCLIRLVISGLAEWLYCSGVSLLLIGMQKKGMQSPASP